MKNNQRKSKGRARLGVPSDNFSTHYARGDVGKGASMLTNVDIPSASEGFYPVTTRASMVKKRICSGPVLMRY